MSQDVKAMKKELQRLREQKVIDDKANERADDRINRRDGSGGSFAGRLNEDSKRIAKRIAVLEAEIEAAEGSGQKS